MRVDKGHLKLNNCLHCGEPAFLEKFRHRKYTHYCIRCSNCGIATRGYENPKAAADIWNHRDDHRLPEGLRNVIEHNKGA